MHDHPFCLWMSLFLIQGNAIQLMPTQGHFSNRSPLFLCHFTFSTWPYEPIYNYFLSYYRKNTFFIPSSFWFQSFQWIIMKKSLLISFRIDWFNLPAVQGTLKSLLEHHNSKASVLRHSAFFMPQLSHPYMTTGKAIALTRWTLVGKVMSLLLICYLGWS